MNFTRAFCGVQSHSCTTIKAQNIEHMDHLREVVIGGKIGFFPA